MNNQERNPGQLPPDRHERVRLAYHEAGHALADLLLDLAFTRVTIAAGQDDELGSVDTGNPLLGWSRGDGSKRHALDSWCIACYAGWAAEMTRFGSATNGHEQDFDSASYWITASGLKVRGASFVGDDAHKAYEWRLQQRAVALMRQHRESLDRIAAALLEHETLSMAEVRTVAGL